MKSRFSLPVIFLLTAGTSSCVVNELPRPNYKIGDVVESAITVGGSSYPLLPGKYVVTGVRASESGVTTGYQVGRGAPLHDIALLKIDGNQVIEAVNIVGTAGFQQRTNTSGWNYESQCERKDIIFVQKLSNTPGSSQDCYFVNHMATAVALSAPESTYKQSLDYMNAQGIEVPVHAIAVGFRFANKDDLANIRYIFNPEAKGFPKSKDSRWEGSDWHKDRLYRDPSRAAYINKLIDWAHEWHSKYRLAFDTKGAQNSAISVGTTSSQTPMQSEARVVKENAEIKENAAQKLQQLKTMFDEKLITPAEYESQKKRILDRM